MASSLSQFQMMKSASDRLVVAIEDVSDLWPVVRENFEARVPLRRVILNNKARNPVLVEKLPVEYILTTDARLRGRTPLEQTPFWFRHPYASVVLVACEDLDEYKQLLKPRLKQIVQNDYLEWFIVFVSKTPPNDPNFKQTKKVYYRLEADFSSKKRERCCKLETHIADPAVWEDIEHKVVVCIQNTLDRRVQYYEEEVRRLSEHRFVPNWNFCTFFVGKESLAIMFEMAHLLEDALREYDELEQIYLEIGEEQLKDTLAERMDSRISPDARESSFLASVLWINAPNMKSREFGGTDPGDERAAILDASRKPFAQFQLDDAVKEFDFRQYLFARQSALLFYLNRPAEVAARAFPFIMTFSRSLQQHESKLPFCLRELWVLTACLTIVKASADRFNPRSVTPDVEKDFYRLQADLYLYARTKLMRLADLVGYGSRIEKSPCNSAALSMSPWPKPAVWPPVPADAAARILAKQEQSLSERSDAVVNKSKELPLAPGLLLREANRRRASLSAGNLSEVLERSNSLKEGFKRSESMIEEGSRGSFRSTHLSSSNGSLGPEGVNSPRSVPASPSGHGLPRARSGRLPVPPLSPSGSWVGIDRPMKLAEIHVAAEDALKSKDCDEGLQKALSSIEEFEEMYLELTRAAADNFHRSWRKRHGVVLDGEVAAVQYRRGNLDSAAKLYEKVCALYSGERWHALLAEVLPRLSDCQKQLGDWAGYLNSCVRLLSLDVGLLMDEERQTLQSEIVRLAHSGLKVPVSLDVSFLITFASKGGPPLELCEGDPGALQVIVWSGFPDDISLESLSLTLVTTFSADEGAKVVKSVDAPVLSPGKNSVSILLPPQRPGSYVLGVLTGHIGEVKLRSHTYCSTSASSWKGGPPDSDDYLSIQEKPIRPVLEVFKPRPLVTAQAAVSWRILIGEPQWVGIVIEPLDYSLKGARVTVSPGPGLDMKADQSTQLEAYQSADFYTIGLEVRPLKVGTEHVNGEVSSAEFEGGARRQSSESCHKSVVVEVRSGQVDLPEWASCVSTVLWLRVVADVQDENSGAELLLPTSPRYEVSRKLSFSKSAKDIVTIQSAPFETGDIDSRLDSSRHATSTAEGMRTINFKLEFGAGRSRVFERAIAVQFTKPFRVKPRVVSQGNDGTLILQVTVSSELVATTTILDARLELQAGFVHVDADERPSPSWLLPLKLSATCEGALLFVVRSTSSATKEGSAAMSNGDITDNSNLQESKLIVHYKISGDRKVGAHAPVRNAGEPRSDDQTSLIFTNSFVLQMPVLEQLVAVGMLPVPTPGPRVGQQVTFQWRVERLKEGWIKKNRQGDGSESTETSSSSDAQEMEDLEYELQASTESWMIAGRKKGHILLPSKMGAKVFLSMACVPLVAGHVHPPSLCLANISRAHVSSSPAGPHIVCVLPPALCSTLCASKAL